MRSGVSSLYVSIKQRVAVRTYRDFLGRDEIAEKSVKPRRHPQREEQVLYCLGPALTLISKTPMAANGHANGVNGANGVNKEKTGIEVPATSILASFVANATTSQLTPALRSKIIEVLIDYIGVAVGGLSADSTEPTYNAILKLQGSIASGQRLCTVIGKGEPRFLAQYAGLLNAALSHSLDFDDTYAEGTLHAGCTAISAALAEAEVLGSDVSAEDFMLAVALGYEVTCRLGRELGFEAYDRGFHNTGTAGVFGAVAVIASLRRLSAQTIEMAFGLAGSKAAGSMQYLDNGSW
jgi:2-methylcitrate dehydratase PrpD